MKRRNISTWHCLPVQPTFIIGTYNEDGTPDFAPITWVSKTCEEGDEYLIVISMWGDKQTKINALRNREFTMNLVNTDMLALVDYFGHTSGKRGYKAGIEYGYGRAERVNAPTLDDSRFICECEVKYIFQTGESHTLFCKVANVQLDERLGIEEDGADLSVLDAVIYSGRYHSIDSCIGRIGDYYSR